MGKNFTEFMNKTKEINRWIVTGIFLTGIFAGACLMFIFMLAGI